MKIFRNIIAIFLALFLISKVNQGSDNRLAEASEIAHHSCDHSACEEEIAACEEENRILRAELEEAKRSRIMILRIEIEFIPGLFGDWARVSFYSDPIEISAAEFDRLSIGDDICQDLASDIPFAENLIECRVIIDEIISGT